MDQDYPAHSASNPDLALERQRYGDDPLSDRETDHYRNEYITAFVDKWDSLIDWEARKESEGAFFINILRSRNKHTVLDAATGTGFHSVSLLEAGFDVTSADGSAPMLARAFENGKKRGLILKTVKADWRWLGQATRERYDAIVCLGNSFTHVHDELDRRRVLAEFYAALEPNGLLIIDQRNYDYMLDNGFKSKHKYYYCGDQVSAEPIHIEDDLVRFQYSFPDETQYTLNLHPIRKDYVRCLLREAGFERIRTYGDFQAAYDADDPDFFVHVAEKSAVPAASHINASRSSRSLAITEDYYDSDDADAFYSTIWGGEDIHLGLYDKTDDIRKAGFATVDLMASRLPDLGQGTKVIDFGAGYGGSARQLAHRSGCSVVCLNLSETQNDRNRLMTAQADLADTINVQHGNFEDVPAANDSFDVVWSQDAFLHSSNRDRVMAEAFRVLKPGGRLIFTDPMQADDCPPGVLKPIYDRLYLSSLGSIETYRRFARMVGLEEVEIIDLSSHLEKHYSRILEELCAHRDQVEESASEVYVSNMIQGLERWIEGGRAGHLTWAILHFQKPA